MQTQRENSQTRSNKNLVITFSSLSRATDNILSHVFWRLFADTEIYQVDKVNSMMTRL